jgi:hypothetical protein
MDLFLHKQIILSHDQLFLTVPNQYGIITTKSNNKINNKHQVLNHNKSIQIPQTISNSSPFCDTVIPLGKSSHGS